MRLGAGVRARSNMLGLNGSSTLLASIPIERRLVSTIVAQALLALFEVGTSNVIRKFGVSKPPVVVGNVYPAAWSISFALVRLNG